MLNSTYTVISFGNYETKILVATLIDNKIFPIYKASFLTNSCFQDSNIVDDDLLIKTLKKEFTNVPIDLASTNLILNIPLKSLEILTNKVNKMPISKKSITKKEIYDLIKITENNVSSEKYELDKQVIYWKINGDEIKKIEDNMSIETISWKINSYYTKKNIVNKFIELMKNFDCEPCLITCDSLVMNHLFKNKERKYKVLINIGHLKSSFEIYENEVLIDQKSIDFGIRHLTSEIGKTASVDEKKSIEILKIYKDVVSINKNLALINHYKEKYLDYSQTKISDINKLIGVWIMQLTSLMNMYLKEKEIDILGVDEIYFYSPMNILDAWFPHIRNALDKRADIFSIEPDIFSIHEPKYCSLIATILYFLAKQQTKQEF